MKIHTCFITYNRLDLTKQAIASYLETVTVPFTMVVVDNGSTDGTPEWLLREFSGYEKDVILLDDNHYPGYACNRGWETAPADATHLHRADNDFRFLPKWDIHMQKVFRRKEMGQVGLRTKDEELRCATNVGGNCVIARELWDKGLRYDERPWPQIRDEAGPGITEDSFFSPAVVAMGYEWARVTQPCIFSLATGDWSDPYYRTAYEVRGIKPHPDDPTLPPELRNVLGST